MNNVKVINIQKYSIHDGPGIRTTVFLKGCPLKCLWCHNPESQSFDKEIMIYEERCVGCGRCIKVCPSDAINFKNNKINIDNTKCIKCGRCADVCINKTLEIVGENKLLDDVYKEILKDEVFYDESNGGVTFSGGEPMMHGDFLLKILKKCKEKSIHTTIDTSGYANWDEFEKIIDYVDLFLFDIKHMDSQKHKKYTGVNNEIILDNLKNLSYRNKDIFIRVPLIKDINDYDKNIISIIEFLKDINVRQVNLLPYHKMGKDKYRRLKLETVMNELEAPSDERIKEIEKMFSQSGIKVKIGG